MIDSYKLIKKTEDYSIYEAIFENKTQIFRIWTSGEFQVKLTDEYAIALGYKDIQDLFDKIPGFKENLIATCGKIPKWLRIEETAKFIVRYTQTNISLN